MGNTCRSSSSSSIYEDVISMPLRLVENLTQIDATHIQELISFINLRFNAITKPDREGIRKFIPSASVTYFIQFGGHLLENVSERVNNHVNKIPSKAIIGRETRKAVMDALKNGTKIEWIAVGLSVIGYVLDQMEQVTEKYSECVQLLVYMFVLAKRIKQLDERLAEEKKKLNDVVHFIVEGSLTCISLMKPRGLSRVFVASIEIEDLRSLEAQLGLLHPDLAISTVNCTIQGQYPDSGDETSRLLDINSESMIAV